LRFLLSNSFQKHLDKMMGFPQPCRPEEKYAIRSMAVSSFVTICAGIGFIRILPVLLETVGAADLN